jgi:hypothetical protein
MKTIADLVVRMVLVGAIDDVSVLEQLSDQLEVSWTRKRSKPSLRRRRSAAFVSAKLRVLASKRLLAYAGKFRSLAACRRGRACPGVRTSGIA